LGEGAAHVSAGAHELLLSSRRSCPKCGRGFPELDPRFFSFNTRQGACPECEGAGVIERPKRGGDSVFETCPACKGGRLAGLALHTTVADLRIGDVLALSVERALARLKRVTLEGREHAVGDRALRESLARLGFLARVGLSYLSLDRPARTLSGGEMQRVRLAAQLGAGLTGVLYVLDEPTIGLHARDTDRLLEALRALRDQGCSVLVVEHDADTIRAADHVIDMGPGGGHLGGRIVAEGPPMALLTRPESVTGLALARPLRMVEKRRPVTRGGPWLVLRDARANNLRAVDLRVPVGRLVVVTGVSGSGKSTLVRATLLRAVRQALGLETDAPGAHAAVEGAEAFARALEIDQTPIGRTPRSVPATYIGVWDEIRKLYAQSPDARAKGWNASRFSFNVAAGSCPACEGQGAIRVEMAFLPDAHVRCEECDGQRFEPGTLGVKLRGLSAGQLLALHVDEAAELLKGVPKVRRPLDLLCQLGLGYLTLGQASNTLSGGEAQRLKLVSELSTSGQGRALYVMDEPTTGLHRDDVGRLLGVLDGLVDRGDTLLVIEHHPDVIASADWVVDLGPEGGEHGGRIVAEGTPETLIKHRTSHTGAMLRRELRGGAGGYSRGSALR
jgi:excinuclease ABC subunit A